MRTIGAIALAVVSIGLAQAISAGPAAEDCTLGGSLGIASVEARCGFLERPENPSDPDSARIRLRFIVVPSLSPNPLPDAFTVINGGPGASSIDLYADSAGVFAPILRERDIIVLDQRGTGGSNPLDCPDLEAMNLDFAADRIRAATLACLDGLPGDPRFYTTSLAVRDLEALRIELGYAALNVYGVSYGTRVAQHYARRYPDAVRTLIIDGVTPPEVPLGPNAALNAQRTLESAARALRRRPGMLARLSRCRAESRFARPSPEDRAGHTGDPSSDLRQARNGRDQLRTPRARHPDDELRARDGKPAAADHRRGRAARQPRATRIERAQDREGT